MKVCRSSVKVFRLLNITSNRRFVSFHQRKHSADFKTSDSSKIINKRKNKIRCSFHVVSYIVCFRFFILYLHTHGQHLQVIARRLQFDYGNLSTLFVINGLKSVENHQKPKFLEMVESSAVNSFVG